MGEIISHLNLLAGLSTYRASQWLHMLSVLAGMSVQRDANSMWHGKSSARPCHQDQLAGHAATWAASSIAAKYFCGLGQDFYGVLVQHFALRAGAQPLPLGELDALTVHLLALTPEVRSTMSTPGRQGHSTEHFVAYSQHSFIHPALRRHASDHRSFFINACTGTALGRLLRSHAV